MNAEVRHVGKNHYHMPWVSCGVSFVSILWKNDHDMRKVNFFFSDVGDKMIEVVGLEGAMHAGQIKAGIRSSGRRLAQASQVVIRSVEWLGAKLQYLQHVSNGDTAAWQQSYAQLSSCELCSVLKVLIVCIYILMNIYVYTLDISYIDCRYNMVQYNTIMHTSLPLPRGTLIKACTHKWHPYLALTGELWGVYCENITRVASWSPDRRKWLNQLTVKNLFFSLFIKTFCLQHHHIVHEKTINLGVWMKEICTLLVKLHIIFSRTQRVNQHARPSIIQVGCPTCCYQVCALDHTNMGTADLD